MTAPLHFAYPYVMTTLCNAYRRTNVRDTSSIENVTCNKCLKAMKDPVTGVRLAQFDTPRSVAAGIDGLLARGVGLDEWSRECLTDFSKRLQNMERRLA